MRGDIGSNHTLHRDDVPPVDSSSSGSSPRSNSSHDDDILEVRRPELKPIYNFSIPDVIKHERHVESHETVHMLNDRIPVHRKRAARHIADDITCSDANDMSIAIRSKRRKRSVATLENVNGRDDDCHRPPVIDLTDIDSHDEYHSDMELHESGANSRSLGSIPQSESFSAVLSDLQQFQRELQDSSDARLFFQSPSVQRFHNRLRRRRNSRPHDPSLATDDILFHSQESNSISTPEMTSADDSVIVINEIRGNQFLNDEDHSIAMRMANDPTYSPPYHIPTDQSPGGHRNHSRLTRSDESFHQFQERIRSIRQRSRDRLEQARRISHEAQERLARIHDSINNLRSSRLSSENPSGDSGNRSTHESRGQRDSNDDVEIIHEWNPRDLGYLNAPINLSPLQPSVHSSMHSLSRRHLPMPDFLRPLMSSFLSPVPPPRLHHLHHIQEDYEALLNLAERIGPAKPRGLIKTEIDRIPSFRYSSSTAKETNAKCIICMNEYAHREKLRRLACTHDFHSKCIDKWLRSNKTCPICRDEVNATSDDGHVYHHNKR